MSNTLLQTPIEYLKGVGPQRGELLRKELGIHRYDDLINFFPNRYIDRTRYYKINELQKNDSEVQIIGKIVTIKTVEFGKVSVNFAWVSVNNCCIILLMTRLEIPRFISVSVDG